MMLPPMPSTSTSIRTETMAEPHASEWAAVMPVLPPGLKLAIDADCPSCGWVERNFDGKVFGCRKCDYTSEYRNS